ncbi:MAG: acetylxylan esterase [Verrucomicrobia bacterium]|nr:acetylxylan esterase [Verrucomicrobiota bacterium]
MNVPLATVFSLCLAGFLGAGNSTAAAIELPDPLRSSAGKTITAPAQWEQRRAEIIALYETHVFGPRITTTAKASFELRTEKPDALGGIAVRREIRIYLLGAKTGPWLDLLLYLPKGAPTKVPAFFGFNYMGNQSVTAEDDVTITPAWIRPAANTPGIVKNRATAENRGAQARRWPLELILRRGYAVATACFGEVEPDDVTGWTRSPLRTALGLRTTGERSLGDPGAIAIWAFGASRVLDCLESIPEIDATRVALTGHSRMGKTALWAAALDRRFALVVSNNSGEGGAALARRKQGERIADSVKLSGYWYTPRYRDYVDREEHLPVDAHWLLALIAPRPLYVSSATQDLWADPEGEFLAARHASAVYALWGHGGVTGELPPPDTPVGQHIGYHIRTGPHDILAADWSHHLDFADRFWRPAAPANRR